jgi:hypothetical protein
MDFLSDVKNARQSDLTRRLEARGAEATPLVKRTSTALEMSCRDLPNRVKDMLGTQIFLKTCTAATLSAWVTFSG